MAQFEVLVLDGLTLTGDPTGTIIVEAVAAPPAKARPEWSSGADTEGSALIRQPGHENREITLRLRVGVQATMNAALDQVAAVVDKLRKASATSDGIAMTWTPADSTRTVTFDVLHGEITDLPITWGGDDTGWFQRRPVMNVTLTAEPYWRGTETLTSTASASSPITTLEVASVPGDIPALGRLIVTDTATQSRRHVEWGLENRSYDAATSLIVDSDSMSVTGLAGAQTTRTGAHDPNATGNNVIRATLAADVPMAIAATGNLSHVGTFRVKARVYASATTVRVRLAWRCGEGKYTTNAYAAPAVSGAFAEVDLGTVVVPPATSGTQRWDGRIEAYGSSTVADTLDVDYLILIPAGEGYGRARGEAVAESVTIFSARDEFNQAAGALTGKVASAGGTWAGAGDADDFTVNAAFTTAFRNALSDVDVNTGRYATLGATNFTDVLVQADTWTSGVSAASAFDVRQGVIARYTDTNNWLMAVVEGDYTVGASVYSVKLVKRQAGVVTTLATYLLPKNELSRYATLRLVVDVTGTATVWHGSNYGVVLTGRWPALQRVIVATDAALATGGVLATGKPGIYHAWTGNIANDVWIDRFFVSVPAPTYVINSGRSIQFRHDTTIRTDSAGTVYGPPPAYRGTRFLVPPGTSRVAVKARRLDTESGPDDPVTDATQIQVGYTPRGLVVPR